MKNFGTLFSLAVAGLILGVASGAHANPNGTPDALTPGKSNFLNASPVGVYEQFGFTGNFGLLASYTSAFSGSPVFSGILTSTVIAGDTRNPLNGLDFVYQFSNDLGGTGTGIIQMTINGFAGASTDVGFIQASITERRPSSVARATANSGDVISWNFATPGELIPGMTSATLIVYTDALTFQFSTVQFIDPGIAGAVTFAPIPEPESYAMLLAGLGLMSFMVRRCHGKNAGERKHVMA